ncbi:proliferating cell nuclear antigen [Tulasnella sp. 419]|nr:proliferating cell nuclear antigen [Tulasnella sp. 418]KAG8960196.1 proliferating cell nuclear antigen [Tulasnella sp. 419]
MLEAKLETAVVLKKLLDAIKELVTDANFECNEDGISLQAMDNSHVALVSVKLNEDAFLSYRCDHPMPLGVNLTSLTKVLKCAKDDDKVTLRAADNADTLNLTYEAARTDRIAEYDMKLMDIDSDQLGIPETEYDAQVWLASSEFQRICRDLSQLGESVKIEVSKEGVRFTAEGEAANGSVLLKQSKGKIEKVGSGSKSKKPKVKEEEDDDVKPEPQEEEDSDEETTKSKKKKVKKEKAADDDGDEDMGDDDDGEDEAPADSDEDAAAKKRKRNANGASSRKKVKTEGGAKKKKARKDEDEDDSEDDVEGAVIQMNQHVNLTFSLKYLVNFAKSSTLCKRVVLKMSNDVPLLVNFDFGNGQIAYYLAPKIGDE